MVNMTPFIVMNYMKRKEKENKIRIGKTTESIFYSKSKIKLSNDDDLSKDVKELIEYGIFEL